MSETTDRILDILDAGLQNRIPDTNSTFGYGTDTHPELCARCQKHAPHDTDSDLCTGCRNFLLGDTDTDPAARPRPGSAEAVREYYEVVTPTDYRLTVVDEVTEWDPLDRLRLRSRPTYSSQEQGWGSPEVHITEQFNYNQKTLSWLGFSLAVPADTNSEQMSQYVTKLRSYTQDKLWTEGKRLVIICPDRQRLRYYIDHELTGVDYHRAVRLTESSNLPRDLIGMTLSRERTFGHWTYGTDRLLRSWVR